MDVLICISIAADYFTKKKKKKQKQNKTKTKQKTKKERNDKKALKTPNKNQIHLKWILTIEKGNQFMFLSYISVGRGHKTIWVNGKRFIAIWEMGIS